MAGLDIDVTSGARQGQGRLQGQLECLDISTANDVTSGARRGQGRLQAQLAGLDIDPRRVEGQMTTSPVALDGVNVDSKTRRVEGQMTSPVALDGVKVDSKPNWRAWISIHGELKVR
ncbi:unnamed protein product [Taenia asiatica]|uniref:Uncharacterized protein n=1 Tax=Taenia asiatica TaxID=60517 RepID=A0A3P6Q446_TAEAS|nr:unnamed protein product [Taenia asiatica]